jgi:hypothetical protein
MSFLAMLHLIQEKYGFTSFIIEEETQDVVFRCDLLRGRRERRLREEPPLPDARLAGLLSSSSGGASGV